MQRRLRTALAASAIIAGSACATKRGTGAAVGAAGGGIFGAAVGGTTGLVVGAAIGGLLGYTTGRAMEEDDRRRLAYALEADHEAQWTNANTGYRYDVEPTRTV